METPRKPEGDSAEQKNKISSGEQGGRGEPLEQEFRSLFSEQGPSDKPGTETGKRDGALEQELLNLLSKAEPAGETKLEAEQKPETMEQELASLSSRVAEKEKVAEEKVTEVLTVSETIEAEAHPQQVYSERVAEVEAEEKPPEVPELMTEAPRTGKGQKKKWVFPQVKLTPLLNLWRNWLYYVRLFSLRLLRSRQRVITLSVEGNSLRFLSSLGSMVESCESVPLAPGLLHNGFVADPEGVGDAIRSVLQAKRITAGRVVCAFPGLNSASRLLTVPGAARVSLSKIVPREAKRLMSLSLDSNHLVWQILPGSTAELKVFVLAVPREPLSTLVQAIKRAGLNPRAIDLRPLALARAVNRKDAVIAHAEANCIDLAIVVNDFPSLMRSVFLGESGLPAEQVFSRVVEELDRTITFYNRANPERSLPAEVAVYLTGEMLTPTLAGNVAAATGRPVAPLEPPLKLPPDFPVAAFMVNLGLVLKTLK